MTSDPAAWHAKVRAQHRDPQWAPRAEETLRERFSRVAHIGGSGNVLRVLCATSICEVAGTIDVPRGEAQSDSANSPLNLTMQELQGNTLHADLLKGGLSGEGATFTSTKSKPERTAFFFYFSRVTT
ncbi:MAG: hypothetical protein JWO81_3231 [Alphaproteobacteria bacterium]|nr:hypothetical protein [Alphaproteobacteria bacterium]